MLIRILIICCIFSLNAHATFQQFVAPFVSLSTNGKIVIPEHFKHVKLDIGLSYNAPMSHYWLSHEEDLLVFGFEPNPESISMIKRGSVKQHPSHGDPLDTKYLNTSFFLIPCALGISEKTSMKFYVTKEGGCSSLYQPLYLELSHIIDVPIFSLADFFDLFPFDTHPVIEYIKIDAQGADLDIVKSGGNYLTDHVVFITIEAENYHYKGTMNSEREIENYMSSIGFRRHHSNDTQDPTYINSKFLDYAKTQNVKIFQNG